MKIAVLSDIHGNSVALSAVLDSVRNYGISDLIILGDFVGYYYHPDTVLQLLEDFNVTCIRGNHEVILKGLRDKSIDRERIRIKYGSGAILALEKLTPGQIDFLVNLPDIRQIEMDGIRFLLCHGSPSDPDAYVYPDASSAFLEKMAATEDADFILLGHTHYPFARASKGTVILNPGSVGQPRDQSFGASWAIINTSNRAVAFKQTPYCKTGLIAEVECIDPELPLLKEVLIRNPR